MVYLAYLKWHYGIAPKNIVGLTNNFLMGAWHKFAIPVHGKTLLAPWRRQEVTKEKEVGLWAILGETIINNIINAYLRLLAGAIRLSIIIAGLIIELSILVVFILIIALWLLWPAIAITWFVRGVSLFV